MGRAIDVGSAWSGSVLRLGGGLVCRVAELGERPAQLLELYDFEACPYCRKAREALTELDLEARILPCPKGGRRFRKALQARGGKTLFPYLVDPNADVEMYESDDIIRHLFGRYGRGRVPLHLRMGPLTTLSSSLASVVRATRGVRVRPSREPDEPLELWSFEASPYCRLAREALSELELPYILHNVGKRSPSREAFVRRSGRMRVPYLADPNTGVEMHESADIVRYLNESYAL